MNSLLYWCWIPFFSVSLLGMTKCHAGGFASGRASQDQQAVNEKSVTIPLQLNPSNNLGISLNINYVLTDNLPDFIYPLNGVDTHFGIKTTLNLKKIPFFTRYIEFYDPATSHTLATVAYGGLCEIGKEGTTEYYIEHISGPIKINNVAMEPSLFETFKSDYMKKVEENGYDTNKKKGVAKNLKNNKIIKASWKELSYQDSILNIYYKFEAD